jgi:hypothetical protein
VPGEAFCSRQVTLLVPDAGRMALTCRECVRRFERRRWSEADFLPVVSRGELVEAGFLPG